MTKGPLKVQGPQGARQSVAGPSHIRPATCHLALPILVLTYPYLEVCIMDLIAVVTMAAVTFAAVVVSAIAIVYTVVSRVIIRPQPRE